MLERGSGHLVCVSSVAGVIGSPRKYRSESEHSQRVRGTRFLCRAAIDAKFRKADQEGARGWLILDFLPSASSHLITRRNMRHPVGSGTFPESTQRLFRESCSFVRLNIGETLMATF